MQTYTIRTKEQTTIVIGKNSLSKLTTYLKPNVYSRYFLLTDETTMRLFGKTVQDALIIASVQTYCLKPGEESKSFDALKEILQAILAAGLDRKSAVIALGGGVVGDIATLAAGLYQRGIACIQIPTTLLAQVDSSLGGKGAINMGNLKNMLGIIRQPKYVIIDPTVLASLPDKERTSGFAEIIKYATAFSPDLFQTLSSGTVGKENLTEIIEQCVSIKMKVMTNDPQETGTDRFKVNFGHTLGHAIEKEHHLTHGEAIAIGMAFALRLSVKLGLLSEEKEISAISLLKRYNLPTTLPKIDLRHILSMMKKDKKATKGNVRFVLLKDVGQTTIQTVDDTLIMTTLKELSI